MKYPACIVLLLLLWNFPLQGQAGAQTSSDPLESEMTLFNTNGDGQWKLNTSFTYSAGDFGTSTTTRTFYWPFTLRRYFERGNVSFTLPFINQRSRTGIAAIKGRPYRIRSNTSGSERSGSGVGDLLLEGRYGIFDETAEAFDLTAMAGFKFPTANSDEGLGTGKFDGTIGMETVKTLSEFWLLYFDLYYSFIGDPPGTNLNNQFSYDFGLGYNLDDDTMMTLFYKESTALVSSQDNPRELIMGVNHRVDRTMIVYGNAAFGLTEGSPDWALTCGLSYLF